MLSLFNRKQKFRQTPQTLLTQSTGASDDQFGTSVALSRDGNTAIIGAPYDNIGANDNQGSATIFTRSGTTWTQEQTITQSGGAANDNFGWSVALSSDGNTAIVGAYYDDVGSNLDQGSATIFTRSGTTWTQEQTITQTGGAAFDFFGYSVALSSDGNTALVGAALDTVGANNDQGSATIFTRSAGSWTQQQTITQSTGAANDYFGTSVALSSDGNTAIVGAPYDNSNQGSATVFTRTSGTWTQQQTITQTGGAALDYFGWSVALSSDGNTALIGALGTTVAVSNQGSATIFTRASTTWTQQQVITQNDAGYNDQFGISVALSTAGNTAIVGAHADDVDANTNQGSVTIFTQSGVVWTQQKTLTQTGGAADDRFGYAVSISGDGRTALVGASLDDVGANSSQGSATIIYRR